MIFEREYKPELCVSADATRPHLRYVELDVARQRMCATDGHMLAIVPCVPDEHDVSGPLTADALKAARKASKGLPPELTANGAQAIPATGVTFPRPTRDERAPFPPVDQVMPSGDRSSARVALNPAYLLKLAQAIGAGECVELRFALDNDGRIAHLDPIVAIGKHGATGVLMPCRLGAP